MRAFERTIGVIAGLAGAAGVAASAAGSHAFAGTDLDTAGKMLTMHAAALLALALAGPAPSPIRRIAAVAMAVGVALVSGDLILRSVAGTPLFPMAAPLGGLTIMASWLIAAVSFIAVRRP